MAPSGFKIFVVILCLSLMLGVSACAKTQKPSTAEYNSHEISDPIEPVNRFIFGFNDVVDHLLIEPLAKGYKALLPTFVRDSVQSFMRNLESPLIIANNLLQGNIGNAGVASARFLINSTAGVLGLVDVAKTQGFVYRDEDFGQTLAVWGAGDGFYLVLPILGPSSLRDATGTVVDTIADPVRIVSNNMDQEWIYYTRGAVQGLDTRSRMIDAINDMRRNSLDYYAAVRSAYGQKRSSLIRNESQETAHTTPGYTDFQ